MKVKIKTHKPEAADPAPKPEASPPQPIVKKKDSIIRNCIRIVVSDFRKKILGEEKMIRMPESNESWNDWEGQL